MGMDAASFLDHPFSKDAYLLVLHIIINCHLNYI